MSAAQNAAATSERVTGLGDAYDAEPWRPPCAEARGMFFEERPCASAVVVPPSSPRMILFAHRARIVTARTTMQQAAPSTRCRVELSMNPNTVSPIAIVLARIKPPTELRE